MSEKKLPGLSIHVEAAFVQKVKQPTVFLLANLTRKIHIHLRAHVRAKQRPHVLVEYKTVRRGGRRARGASFSSPLLSSASSGANSRRRAKKTEPGSQVKPSNQVIHASSNASQSSQSSNVLQRKKKDKRLSRSPDICTKFTRQLTREIIAVCRGAFVEWARRHQTPNTSLFSPLLSPLPPPLPQSLVLGPGLNILD